VGRPAKHVLYPIGVCNFILTASSHQLIAQPVVSGEILDEATRNIISNRPDLEPERIERRFNALRVSTDGHDQPVPDGSADTSIINPKDRHVLAAALHHNVDYIVTNDARLRSEISAWRDLQPRSHKLIDANHTQPTERCTDQ